MEKTYSIVSNEYFNTGGNCMVDITTVWSYPRKSLLYVYISDESLIVSTFDFIREELPGEITAEDVCLVDITHECFTTEPAPDNSNMLSIDDETTLLLLDCLEAYIKHSVKHSRRNYFTTVDKLPNGLREQLTNDYIKWLNENSQLVETDGYKVILDHRYFASSENDEPNAKAAKELKWHLDTCMPTVDIDDDEKPWEDFYEEKLHIIYCGKLFTFENGADVYNGLDEFVKWVIDQQ